MNAGVVVEILAIGREILDGRVVDTNTSNLARLLAPLGLVPRFAQRVDDDRERILDAFRLAGSRSRIILVTGGLGPTSDDLTAEVFGRYLGEPVVERADARAQIERYLEKVGRAEFLHRQLKQATLPESCFLMENPFGTAPGFGLERAGQSWFFMPGVPRELLPMARTHILPRLPRVAGYQTRSWATQLIPESELQALLREFDAPIAAAGWELTYRTKFPENHIGLHGVATTPDDEREYERMGAAIAQRIAPFVFAESRGTLELPSMADVVTERLRARGARVVTAESCTAGRVGAALTAQAGASDYFWGGWMVYDNAAKMRLGVEPALLASHGAVSAEVAHALAQAALDSAAQAGLPGELWSVATTGIAGPSGGSDSKPVGLCWVGIGHRSVTGQLHVKTERVLGRQGLGRDQYLDFFTHQALNQLRLALGSGAQH